MLAGAALAFINILITCTAYWCCTLICILRYEVVAAHTVAVPSNAAARERIGWGSGWSINVDGNTVESVWLAAPLNATRCDVVIVSRFKQTQTFCATRMITRELFRERESYA